MTLKLSAAQAIVEHALQHARSLKFRPLSIAVLDSRSAVIAAASEDGTSLKRFQVAHGKAHRALAVHGGSARPLGVMAVERPHSSAAPWAVLVAVGI